MFHATKLTKRLQISGEKEKILYLFFLMAELINIKSMIIFI
ncbi:hypothetical protein HMPREF9148_02595 [Prevotella sp. F0091]|nr:hypothetical protein HMPREF9148_02595 [Prevotella sp. F0091]